MPLKINLKKGQKIILNGAVLENSNAKNVSFSLLNEVAILRDSEILSPEDTSTPAARVYYCLQCAYLFPHELEKHLKQFHVFLTDFEQAVPSSKELIETIRGDVQEEKYYSALKECRQLISYESEVLGNVRKPEPTTVSESS